MKECCRQTLKAAAEELLKKASPPKSRMIGLDAAQIIDEGRQAARDGDIRYSPYLNPEADALWKSGYDEVMMGRDAKER